MSHILNVQNLEPEHVTVSSIITEEDLAEEFGWDDRQMDIHISWIRRNMIRR